MDPNDARSRSPSLLDATSHGASSSAAPDRILSGIEASAGQRSHTVKSRRWLWPSVLLLLGCAAVLLLLLGGAFDDSGSISSSRMMSQAVSAPVVPAPSPVVPLPNVSATADDQGVGRNAAVILPEPEQSIDANARATSAPASSSSSDSAMLSEVFTPTAERQRARPVRRAVERVGTNNDSDVTLLTALIQHVEVSGPVSHHKSKRKRSFTKAAAASDDSIEARMQACPAANTEAGLRCRQKLCDGHSGASACPAASSDAGEL